jgi:hypothetical protein
VFVAYHPEGSEEPTKWTFVPGKVRNSRAAMIEKMYGKAVGAKATFEVWKLDVQQGSAAARQVLLWHLQSLDHHTLKLEDVDFAEDELIVSFSRGELEDMREAILSAKRLDEAQREMMLATIDGQMETAEDDGGKARSSDSASPTGSTSPPTSTSDPES